LVDSLLVAVFAIDHLGGIPSLLLHVSCFCVMTCGFCIGFF
jgi:hypothetical protein